MQSLTLQQVKENLKTWLGQSKMINDLETLLTFH